MEHLILEVRDIRVMLDRDLAALYGVETRALNQAVQRNLDHFPPDFSFLLTRQEVMRISQIVISSEVKYAQRVRAFTEQGIAMLSSVLRSPRATAVNIEIMRTFVRMWRLEIVHSELAKQLEALRQHIGTHDLQIEAIFEAIQQLLAPASSPRRQIGFTAPQEPT